MRHTLVRPAWIPELGSVSRQGSRSTAQDQAHSRKSMASTLRRLSSTNTDPTSMNNSPRHMAVAGAPWSPRTSTLSMAVRQGTNRSPGQCYRTVRSSGTPGLIGMHGAACGFVLVHTPTCTVPTRTSYAQRLHFKQDVSPQRGGQSMYSVRIRWALYGHCTDA